MPSTAGEKRARSRRHWSVRTYLAVILAVAVAAVGAATAYGFVWSAERARGDATRQMNLEATRAASAISESIASVKRTVAAVAAQPGLDRAVAGRGACQLTADGTEAFPSVRLDIVAANGRVGCTSAPTRAVTSGHLDARSVWLDQVVRSPGQVVAWDATDPARHEPAVVVASPVRANGRAVGAVAAVLDLPEAGPALAANFSGIEHATFAIV